MNKLSVCYLRVSTLQQKVDSQRQTIKNECDKRKLVIWSFEKYQEYKNKFLVPHNVAIMVEDKGTGANQNREGLQWMLGQVRANHVDSLLCYDVSRLGRSLRQNLEVMDLCLQLDVELFGINGGIDIRTKEGRLIFAQLSAVAEYLREEISQKVKDGIAARLAKGLKHGGTAPGWTKHHVRKQLPLMYELLDHGQSLRHISKMTGLQTRTIRKYRDRRNDPVKTKNQINTEVYGKSSAK